MKYIFILGVEINLILKVEIDLYLTYNERMTKEELKRKREYLGLTQTKLAEILGVKNNTVARWESGVLVVPKVIELAMLGIQIKMGKDVMAAAAELLPIAEREAAKTSKVAKTIQSAESGRTAKLPVLDDDEWLSTIQVAERLGVSRKSINDYIIDGKLPATKGKQNHNFIKLSDVLIYETVYAGNV